MQYSIMSEQTHDSISNGREEKGINHFAFTKGILSSDFYVNGELSTFSPRPSNYCRGAEQKFEAFALQLIHPISIRCSPGEVVASSLARAAIRRMSTASHSTQLSWPTQAHHFPKPPSLVSSHRLPLFLPGRFAQAIFQVH